MTKREQFEELHDVLVFPGSDTGHQGVIHELEFLVSKPVPAPVHRLGGKQEKQNEDILSLILYPSFYPIIIFRILEVARMLLLVVRHGTNLFHSSQTPNEEKLSGKTSFWLFIEGKK